MMRKTHSFLAIAASVAISGSIVLADADAAKNYVKEATELVGSNDVEGASNKLELAEAELDGVDAAQKSAITAQITALKSKITAQKASVNKGKYQRNLDRAMREAEGSIGNLVTWGGAESDVNDLFKNEEALAAIPDEIAAAKKKFATFQKLNAKKAGPQRIEEIDNQLKQVETDWAERKAEITNPETSPNSKSDAIDRTDRDIQSVKKRVEERASVIGEEAVKSFNERIDKVSGEFMKIALADRVKEVVESLTRKSETYKDDWDGWEAEAKGPTWDEYTKESSQKMSAFFAPKTKELISRFDDYISSLADDSEYQSVSSAAEVKAIVDDVKARRDKAYKKMLGFVTAVVEPALKGKVEDTSRLSSLKDDVRLALGEKSPEGLALQEKLEAKIKGHEDATTGAEDAKKKLITDLQSKATDAWAGLHEGLSGATEYDLPSQVGKTVSFTADNLMGYRFKPGDYYFATTLSGAPVAAKIDPALMKQIKATEEAIGRSIGDDDSDGKWEVFAVVTDKKVKLQARKQVEASGTIGGGQVKITGEYAEPVEATVIEIIAAKCGPFAGAKGKGVLKTDGTVGN